VCRNERIVCDNPETMAAIAELQHGARPVTIGPALMVPLTRSPYYGVPASASSLIKKNRHEDFVDMATDSVKELPGFVCASPSETKVPSKIPIQHSRSGFRR
jgi:hypothetical protein